MKGKIVLLLLVTLFCVHDMWAQSSSKSSLDSLVDYVNCQYVQAYINNDIIGKDTNRLDIKGYLTNIKGILESARIDAPIPYDSLAKKLKDNKWPTPLNKIATIINGRKQLLEIENSDSILVKVFQIVGFANIEPNIAKVLLPTQKKILIEIQPYFFPQAFPTLSPAQKKPSTNNPPQQENIGCSNILWTISIGIGLILGMILAFVVILVFIKRRGFRRWLLAMNRKIQAKTSIKKRNRNDVKLEDKTPIKVENENKEKKIIKTPEELDALQKRMQSKSMVEQLQENQKYTGGAPTAPDIQTPVQQQSSPEICDSPTREKTQETTPKLDDNPDPEHRNSVNQESKNIPSRNTDNAEPTEQPSANSPHKEYKYLKYAMKGRFDRPYSSPEGCIFRYTESKGNREFEFIDNDANARKALANLNATFDDVCEFENDYEGARRITTKTRGILDRDLTVIKKAIISFDP
jgi:hypothetical protein